uniref:Uncharacterized protein n=1 Tax=Anguilla anguilla TaxID=7936 RepID=A0A0E9TW79_ANGAN
MGNGRLCLQFLKKLRFSILFFSCTGPVW